MPISKEEFEKRGTEAFTVYEFLKRRKTKAFTAQEIASELHLTLGRTFLEDILGTLHLMRSLETHLSMGNIEGRICNGEVYYAWRK